MPRLQHDRHELYCKHRAKGAIPKKAMIAAGFPQGGSTYQTLEDDPEIQQRILELTHEIQTEREQKRIAALEAARMVGQVTGITKAWVIQKLAENALAAKEDGEYKDSNYALELIGKEYGMFDGDSAVEDEEGNTKQVVDLDKTEALLGRIEGALLPEPAPPPEVDLAAIERLIQGSKPVKAAQRELTTGSETDVALTAAVETEDA